MRDRYWAMFCDLKYKERYYWHYPPAPVKKEK